MLGETTTSWLDLTLVTTRRSGIPTRSQTMFCSGGMSISGTIVLWVLAPWVELQALALITLECLHNRRMNRNDPHRAELAWRDA